MKSLNNQIGLYIMVQVWFSIIHQYVTSQIDTQICNQLRSDIEHVIWHKCCILENNTHLKTGVIDDIRNLIPEWSGLNPNQCE
jgi:hypothetical protein